MSISDTSPTNARRTTPAITVQTIADELVAKYPDQLTEHTATKLVIVYLENHGYSNMEPQDAVWSSNREQIMAAFWDFCGGTG